MKQLITTGSCSIKRRIYNNRTIMIEGCVLVYAMYRLTIGVSFQDKTRTANGFGEKPFRHCQHVDSNATRTQNTEDFLC